MHKYSLHKKCILWGLISCVAVLSIAVVAIVFLTYAAVELDIGKKIIAGRFSQATGGRLAYHDANIRWFPAPHIIVRDARFVRPDGLSAVAKSLSLYPAPLALVQGALSVRAVSVTSLRLVVPLQTLRRMRTSGSIRSGGPTDSDAAGSGIPWNALHDCTVNVAKARLSIRDEQVHTLFALETIGEQTIRLDRGTLSADITCSSGLWERMSIKLILKQALDLDITPRARIQLKGSSLDVADLKRTIGMLVREKIVSKTFFPGLIAGRISEIRLSGDVDATGLHNIVADGRIENGSVKLSRAGGTFFDIDAGFTLLENTLRCTDMEARYRRSRLNGAVLRLGLERSPDSLVYFESAVQAQARDVLHLLRALSRGKNSRKIFNDMRDLSGTLSGTLILGDSRGALQPDIIVDSISLKGHYRPIPGAIGITEGNLGYQRGKLALQGVSGSIGSSTFASLNGSLDFSGEPYAKVASVCLVLHTAELAAAVREVLAAEGIPDMFSAEGTVHINQLSGEGPLLNMQQWQYAAQATLKHCRIQSPRLPAEIRIERASLSIDNAGYVLADSKLALLDATGSITGSIDRQLQKTERAESRFEGTLGPQALLLLHSEFSLPRDLTLKAPLNINDGRLVWKDSDDISLSGTLGFAKDGRVLFEMEFQNRQLRHCMFRIKDKDSGARFTFKRGNNAILCTWKGLLRHATVDRLFAIHQQPLKRLQGDITLRMPGGRPQEWTVQGDLQAEKIIIPGVPLTIEKAAIAAQGSSLFIKQCEVVVAGMHAGLSGWLRAGPEFIVVDADCCIDEARWDMIRKLFRSSRLSLSGVWNLRDIPLTGEIRLAAERFVYRELAWKQVRARVVLSEGTLSMELERSALCGIVFSGNMDLSGAESVLHLQPAFIGRSLADILGCLTGSEKLVSGTGTLSGTLRIEPAGPVPQETLQGSLALQAKNGRIYHYGLLGEIFSILNLTEVFRGGLPDFGQGMGYDRITARGIIDNGTLQLQDATVDCPSMKMLWEGSINLVKGTCDITVLAAPLKTLDFLVSKIPLIRHIIGRRTLTLPLKISGSLREPDVKPMLPSLVGDSVLVKMKDLFFFPLEFVYPGPQSSE